MEKTRLKGELKIMSSSSTKDSATEEAIGISTSDNGLHHVIGDFTGHLWRDSTGSIIKIPSMTKPRLILRPAQGDEKLQRLEVWCPHCDKRVCTIVLEDENVKVD
jgi:hypothetical protein